jgi:MFS family permease
MQNRSYGHGGFNAHMVLVVCTLLFMINYMDRQVLSVVMEPMKLDLGLTDSQAGAIQTVFLMSMAVITIPASYLVDRWSRRKAIGLMAIWWSLFTFVTGLGKSFWGVLLPRTMVGVGETGFSAGGIAWIGSSYPIEKRSRAMGIFYLAIPLGSALGVILGGYISVHFGGWRTPFLWFALPGVILGIIAFFPERLQNGSGGGRYGQAVGIRPVGRSAVPHPQPGLPVFRRFHD